MFVLVSWTQLQTANSSLFSTTCEENEKTMEREIRFKDSWMIFCAFLDSLIHGVVFRLASRFSWRFELHCGTWPHGNHLPIWWGHHRTGSEQRFRTKVPGIRTLVSNSFLLLLVRHLLLEAMRLFLIASCYCHIVNQISVLNGKFNESNRARRLLPTCSV